MYIYIEFFLLDIVNYILCIFARIFNETFQVFQPKNYANYAISEMEKNKWFRIEFKKKLARVQKYLCRYTRTYIGIAVMYIHTYVGIGIWRHMLSIS